MAAAGTSRVGRHCRRWLKCLAGGLALLHGGIALAVPPLVQSGLTPQHLFIGSPSIIRAQNVAGSDAVDLLVVSRTPQGETWLGVLERRMTLSGSSAGAVPRDGFALLNVSTGLPVLARDVQGVYVPNGVAGAGRDMVVLGDVTPDTLSIYRNRGPGSAPRFEPLQRMVVPGARRLHYVVQAPVPPGPGFVNLPLPITLASGEVQVLRFDSFGVGRLLAAPLVHPGGAEDVLLIDDGSGGIRLLSLGAGPPILWRESGDGYAGEALSLVGWPEGATARHGLLGEFDGVATLRDLVVAFSNGEVRRFDGVAAPASGSLGFGFAPAQLAATGVEATELVEFSVGSGPTLQPALVIAAADASLLLVADPLQAGRPFGEPIQRLPGAIQAFGDFGLNLLVFSQSGSGLAVYQRPGAVDGNLPFALAWSSSEPVPIADEFFTASVVATRPSDLADTYAINVDFSDGGTLRVGGTRVAELTPGSGGSATLTFPAGATEDPIVGRAPLPSNRTVSGLRLVNSGVGPGVAFTDPISRPAFVVPGRCTVGESYESRLVSCLVNCFAEFSVPPALADAAGAGKGAASALISPTSADLLRRLRANVFAGSAKGREYTALYGELSGEFYRAMAAQPSILIDYAAARDAWLPAIRSLVDGQGEVVITEAMVDRLEAIATHLIVNGSGRVHDAVIREWALLQPRSQVGRTVAQFRVHVEDLPVAAVFASGFEAPPPQVAGRR